MLLRLIDYDFAVEKMLLGIMLAPFLSLGTSLLHALALPRGMLRDAALIDLLVGMSIFALAIINPHKVLNLVMPSWGLVSNRGNTYLFFVLPVHFMLNLINFLLCRLIVWDLETAVNEQVVLEVLDATDYIEWLRLNSLQVREATNRGDLLVGLHERDYSENVANAFLELYDQGYTQLLAPRKIMATQFLLTRACERQREMRAMVPPLFMEGGAAINLRHGGGWA